MNEKRLLAFDFFCGAGGFSLGLIQAGFEVIGAMDVSPDAFATYMINLGSRKPKIHFTSEKYEAILEEYLEKKMKKYGVFQSGTGWIAGKDYPGVSHFFFGDIREVSGYWILEQLEIYPGDLDLIVGGPPCQGFSKANRKAHVNDIRNELVMEFGKKVKEMYPKTFLMEEVPNILKYKLPNGNNYIEELMEFFGTKYKREEQLSLFEEKRDEN